MKWLKNTLIGGSMAFVLNQFAFPLINYRSLDDELGNEKIGTVCWVEGYKKRMKPVESLEENLLAAHFMASRALPEGGYAMFSKTDVHCGEYAKATFSNYLKLVEGSGEEKNVRLAIGYIDKKTHAWVEYFKNGTWNVFESQFDSLRTTTARTSDLNQYVQNSLNHPQLFADNGRYSPRLVLYGDGEKEFIPSEILSDWRGTFLRDPKGRLTGK
ncbi:MAG: hypothetical protein CMH63_02870 [Nanoarchaeota archaeon]|jgi:hypothetical protein|nr:hypothetical protein [Nanoarchaeota archaeon]|tara:strand:- start:27086 stop:27727 length:642 start_codon:yes stop_codon:yes gene_type:complete